MIDISLEYPFVEDPMICEDWPKSHLDPDDRLRYCDYCCYAFNTMSHVWDFSTKYKVPVRKILHVDELIWKHRCWWKSDPENPKAYDSRFVEFVNQIIRVEERRHEAKGSIN